MADAPRLYRFLKGVLPSTLGRYVHLQVEGVENVPETAPAILASNHLSFIDSVTLPIALPRPMYYLGKAEYFDSWRTRWFFAGVGTVPIRRTGGSSSEAALATGVEILRSGDLVGIYPEGTRSPDGRLYRGKTGPVRMALQAQVPIIPVGIIGTDLAQPPGKYGIKRHPVTIRYGRPLDVSRYADEQDDPFALRSATDELMYEIMMLSGQEYVDEYASRVKSGQVEISDQQTHGVPGLSVREDGDVDVDQPSDSPRRAG